MKPAAPRCRGRKICWTCCYLPLSGLLLKVVLKLALPVEKEKAKGQGSDEAEAVRRKQKICQGSPVQMLSNWKKRGYIRQCEDRPEYYEKTQSYLEKHG